MNTKKVIKRKGPVQNLKLGTVDGYSFSVDSREVMVSKNGDYWHYRTLRQAMLNLKDKVEREERGPIADLDKYCDRLEKAYNGFLEEMDSNFKKHGLEEFANEQTEDYLVGVLIALVHRGYKLSDELKKKIASANRKLNGA